MISRISSIKYKYIIYKYFVESFITYLTLHWNSSSKWHEVELVHKKITVYLSDFEVISRLQFGTTLIREQAKFRGHICPYPYLCLSCRLLEMTTTERQELGAWSKEKYSLELIDINFHKIPEWLIRTKNNSVVKVWIL